MEWILGIVGTLIAAAGTAWLTTRSELRKLREENKIDYSVERAIIHLLESPDYKKRSLKKIRHHLRGFSDDELRQALVRAGAVAFGGEGDEERWGLLSRNTEDVK